MTILHIASIDNYMASGISVIVPEHLRYQNEYTDVALLNCSKKSLENTDENYGFKTFRLYDYKKFDLSKLEYPFNSPKLVVFHSIYYKEFCGISKIIKKLGIPYIIVPHGSLSDLAQNKKRIKKTIGNFLFFNNFIKNCSYIQYLTESEKKSSIKWNKSSFVCGNGIDISNDIYKKEALSKISLNIVFIGRLDAYHKGLDILLEACSLIKEEMCAKKIKLNIYGPDYQQGRRKVIELIETFGLENVVCLNKEVYGEEKNKVLANTDIFILTSRFEGQPLAIMEAMAKGIPVIATPGTSFAEIIEENDLGWKVELSGTDIAKKILEAYDNRHLIDLYSCNAYQYAKNNFSWHKISRDTIKLYENLLKIKL